MTDKEIEALWLRVTGFDAVDERADVIGFAHALLASSSTASVDLPGDQGHKPGCEALGGYGHGVGPCTCKESPDNSQAMELSVSVSAEAKHYERHDPDKATAPFLSFIPDAKRDELIGALLESLERNADRETDFYTVRSFIGGLGLLAAQFAPAPTTPAQSIPTDSQQGKAAMQTLAILGYTYDSGNARWNAPAQSIADTAGAKPVLTAHIINGEVVDVDYTGNLMDGEYSLYTARPLLTHEQHATLLACALKFESEGNKPMAADIRALLISPAIDAAPQYNEALLDKVLYRIDMLYVASEDTSRIVALMEANIAVREVFNEHAIDAAGASEDDVRSNTIDALRNARQAVYISNTLGEAINAVQKLLDAQVAKENGDE